MWPLVLDAIIAGCLWGGHGVAAIDLPLAVAPRRERPFYLAAFATASGVGFAVSVSLSSVAVGLAPARVAFGLTPFEVLFVASALARFGCGVYALRLADARGGSLRALLRTMGALEARGGLLVSYLLFDAAFTRELMRLGYADAEARRDEILEFLRESTATFREPAERQRLASR